MILDLYPFRVSNSVTASKHSTEYIHCDTSNSFIRQHVAIWMSCRTGDNAYFENRITLYAYDTPHIHTHSPPTATKRITYISATRDPTIQMDLSGKFFSSRMLYAYDCRTKWNWFINITVHLVVAGNLWKRVLILCDVCAAQQSASLHSSSPALRRRWRYGMMMMMMRKRWKVEVRNRKTDIEC